MSLSAQEAFRRLTIGDPKFVASVMERGCAELDLHRLEPKTEALLRIGGLVAIDAQPSSYRPAIEEAQRAGATLEDMLAVLLAVADEVGSVRVVAAAPKIALAAGYDVEAALE
jgi:4-carboxymuconolactone decarboxylase